MHNADFIPSQRDFVSQTSSSAPVSQNNQQSVINKPATNNSNSMSKTNKANKLWIILLTILTMIVGFWMGYFINDYFHQILGNPSSLINPVDRYFFEGFESITGGPAANQVIDESTLNQQRFANENWDNSQQAVGGSEENSIIFQGEYIDVGGTITFTSNNECLEDLNLVFKYIQGNAVTFQTGDFILDPDSRNDETAAEGVEFYGEFEEPFCLPAISLCKNVAFSYCFYMTHTNNTHYLNYELLEEPGSESLNQFLEI